MTWQRRLATSMPALRLQELEQTNTQSFPHFFRLGVSRAEVILICGLQHKAPA
jgi:hypothetical protein